jgi:septum formation protein
MIERLVLASGSPRRAELLGGLGLMFEIRPADIDEAVVGDESGRAYVERLAVAKAASVAGSHELVIAADTTVDLHGELLGKPESGREARAMLRLLSGNTHHVHTGVCVHRIGVDAAPRVCVDVVTTAVTFAPLPDRWIDWYVGTGEPLDKAGGYGMQGSAALFVASIDGSPTNVIGLPLAAVARLVNEVGTDLFAFTH